MAALGARQSQQSAPARLTRAAALLVAAVLALAACGGGVEGSGPVVRGDVVTSPETATASAAAAQATLSVSTASTPGVVGTAIALAVSGGSGDGAVTFASAGSGCSVSGSALSATTAGSCTVIATKAASSGYLEATSAPVTFTFTSASASAVPTFGFSVSGTPSIAAVGDAIALSATGLPGTGTVVFMTTTDGCMVTGSSLTRPTPGTCSLYATQGAARTWEAASFTFFARDQTGVAPTMWQSPPPGCGAYWRALVSILGTSPLSSMEPATQLGQDLSGMPSPYFCGDTWIPGGFLDTGWDIENSRRTVEFAGWNTAKDGSGVAYTPGVPAPIPTPRVKLFTVYAQWRTCCTVSFEAGGGSGSMSPMTGSVGSSVTLPNVSFTRPGYAAAEWYETKASMSMLCVYGQFNNLCPVGLSETSWPASSQLFLDRSYVLRPDWQPAWTVAFDGNGGSLGAAAQMPPEVFWNKEPRALDLNRFARSGYKFAGWNTRSDGTGTAYSQRQVMTPPADITLYAQWSCTACYTVSFDANGGSGAQATPLTSAGGSSVTAPAGSGYTRAGYEFAGWNTAANGTGTAYAAGASFIPTSSMTLYARWGCKPFTVTITATRFGSNKASVSFKTTSELPMTTLTAKTTDGGQTATVTTTSKLGVITVSGLDRNKTYKFTVTGTNAAGCSYSSGETKTRV